MYKDFLYLQTLAWVNRKRAKRGHPLLAELPMGRPREFDECPVAYGLGSEATVTHTVWSYAGERTRWMPWYVRAFIRRVDRNQYPHLSLNLKEARELADPMAGLRDPLAATENDHVEAINDHLERETEPPEPVGAPTPSGPAPGGAPAEAEPERELLPA